MALNYYCVDAASPYCPCHLAEMDSCLVCSMLQGKELCDCRWQGICVYHEYIWAGKRVEKERKKIFARLTGKKVLSDGLAILKVFVHHGSLLKDFNQPGAFAFLRAADSPEFYDVPLCVMDVDEENGTLTFALHIIGPKTRALARAEKEVILRGPYWNGLFGLKYVKSSIGKRWLLVGKGIGQASLVPVAKNLVRGNNRITAFLDPGGIKVNLAEEILKEFGVNLSTIDLSNTFARNRIKEIIVGGSVDYVYSAGSDTQHMLIQNIINKSNRQIPLAISNNHQLCCGEGICGSCEGLIDGQLVHMCKMQLDSKNILRGFKNA
ncbi:sulfide/dihydroorotate dehydrogenase-like FAD/NAD-binding protein [Thermoanaerobacterium sp. DL9XJH110]|uniref:sulfide/dihydroorotate dehydrogenase-like FAD/NAD-binding protein n=1 Tax=Thermoanaerobacterium sp. DL9XJH110 TaxID=3386643 RepID=UPI003BB79677